MSSSSSSSTHEESSSLSPEDFLKAAGKLSSDPNQRLQEPTRKAIDSGKAIIDVHCHLFDRKTINIRYLLKRLGELLDDGRDWQDWVKVIKGSAKVLTESRLLDPGTGSDWDSTTEQEWKHLIHDLKELWEDPNNDEFDVGEILKHLKIVLANDMEGIYKYYKRKFSLTSKAYKPLKLQRQKMVITALMMDLEQGWMNGTEAPRPITQVVDDLLELAQNYPVLPYFAVDPRRADLEGDKNLYALFLRAFPEEGPSFFGVKVYPALGYLPSDHRLDPIFQICEAKGIPVLTHCGGSIIHSSLQPLEAYRGHDEVTFDGSPEENAEQLNDPSEWLPVLKKYPNLRLNLAHFGTVSEWEGYDPDEDEDHIPVPEMEVPETRLSRPAVIRRMCTHFDHVYTDFAFSLVEPHVYSKLEQALKNDPKLAKRMLYGTDFWVAIPSGDLVMAQIDFLDHFEDRKLDFLRHNPLRYLLGEDPK